MVDNYRKIKVLVVEDEEAIAKNICSKLETIGIFLNNIDCISGKYSSIIGEHSIRENKFDFAVIDLNLPPLKHNRENAEGYKLLEQLHEKNRDCYIIIHSAYSKYLEINSEMADMNIEYADKYIEKSKDSIDLILQTINKEVIYRARMNDYSITHEERIGDLVYSYRTYKLTGPKGSITLTRGCGDLLEFFIENRNIPYAAEDIYEILEEKSSDDPRMAGRQRICTLRRFMEKVGSKKGDEYIKTEKRVGYYIE